MHLLHYMSLARNSVIKPIRNIGVVRMSDVQFHFIHIRRNSSASIELNPSYIVTQCTSSNKSKLENDYKTLVKKLDSLDNRLFWEKITCFPNENRLSID